MSISGVIFSTRSNLSFIAHNLSPILDFMQVVFFSQSRLEQRIDFRLQRVSATLNMNEPGAIAIAVR